MQTRLTVFPAPLFAFKSDLSLAQSVSVYSAEILVILLSQRDVQFTHDPTLLQGSCAIAAAISCLPSLTFLFTADSRPLFCFSALLLTTFHLLGCTLSVLSLLALFLLCLSGPSWESVGNE